MMAGLNRIGLLLLLLLFPLLCTGLQADDLDRERMFVKANSYYSSEQFEPALDLYREIVSTGKVSFELYYNMGNCYYRLGQLGSAIRYWEKARHINPGDSHVNHNLTLARLQITDKMVLPKAFLPLQLWWDLRDALGVSLSFRLSGYFFLTGILLFIFSRTLVRRKSTQHIIRPFVIVSVIACIFTLTLAIEARRYHKNYDFGILLKRQVEVKSAPREGANTLFMLHEGSKVRILDRAGSDWIEISYYDDKVGWIKTKQIGEI
jgi:tetratricopeptide (TPR) repeat protein